MLQFKQEDTGKASHDRFGSLNKDQKEAGNEPCGYVDEEHSGQRNSKCKGPEVGVYLVCLGLTRPVWDWRLVSEAHLAIGWLF